jgi:serine/threonine-protein kinase
MFLDEARLAARLSHPNIVQTYEVGESEGRYFIAMEYLEGQSLRTVQRRLAPAGLPLEEEIRIIAETARGLHYAHDLRGFDGEPLGVVHRDVSPQNVFLTYDGQVKLLDFGIAKTQDAEHLTKVGVIKGKIDYIAPEQVRGDKVDRRADVFALGAMLWEGISGRRFAGGPKVADVTKIHTRVTGGEPKLRDLKPDVAESLADIVDRAIALNPADRYASAAELADDLEKHLESVNLKPSTKTLAELIAPPFQAERDKMRKLVDQQIQIASKRGGVPLGDTTGVLPRLGPNHTRTASGVRPPDVDLTESGFLDLGGDSVPTIETLKSIPAPAALPSAGPRSGVPKLLILSIVGLAIGAGAFLATRPYEGEQQAAVAPQPPQPMPEPVAPPEPPASENVPNQIQGLPRAETVHISVDVWPDTARVVVDGALLPRVPFEADVTKDGAFHHVEASAPGYATVKQAVQFNEDREIKIVLEKEKEQPRVAVGGRRGGGRPQAAPTPAPEPEAQPAPAPAPKPTVMAPGADLTVVPAPRIKPAIDLDDPYADKKKK